MVRTAVLLVALALLWTPVALATAPAVAPTASDPSPATDPADVTDELPRVLLLEDPTRAPFARANLSVSGMLATNRTAMERRLDVYTVEERIKRAGSTDARRAVIESAVDDVDAGVEDLERREAAARQAFLDGDRSPSEYLAVLGHLSVRAAELEVTLDAADRPQVDGTPLEQRIRHLRGVLEAYRGPVRTAARAGVFGTRTAPRIHVAADGNGVALSMVSDGEFVREVHRLDNADDATIPLSAPDALEASELAENLYPRALGRLARTFFTLGNDIHLMDLTHRYGRVVAYADRSRQSVFYEVQTYTLGTLPSGDYDRVIQDGHELSVTTYYAGGPAKIELEDGDGNPANGTLRVEGVDHGSLGDGTRWVVSPGRPFNVSVTTGTTTVSTTVGAEG